MLFLCYSASPVFALADPLEGIFLDCLINISPQVKDFLPEFVWDAPVLSGIVTVMSIKTRLLARDQLFMGIGEFYKNQLAVWYVNTSDVCSKQSETFDGAEGICGILLECLAF